MTNVSPAPAPRGPVSPGRELVFAPRPRGFAASLLRIEPADVRWNREALIEAARKEKELLRGDVAIVSADPTVLVEAWGARVEPAAPYDWRVTASPLTDPQAWADADPPEPMDSQAFAAAIGAAAALEPAFKVAVAIPAPFTLARQLAGGAAAAMPADGDWDALADACGMCVADAAKAVLVEGRADVVLVEDLTGVSADAGQLAGYWTTLVNVLRHHGASALTVVTGGADLGPYRELGVVAAGDEPGTGSWDDSDQAFLAWAQEVVTRPVASPVIPAGVSPERVQRLVRLVEERRASA